MSHLPLPSVVGPSQGAPRGPAPRRVPGWGRPIGGPPGAAGPRGPGVADVSHNLRVCHYRVACGSDTAPSVTASVTSAGRALSLPLVPSEQWQHLCDDARAHSIGCVCLKYTHTLCVVLPVFGAFAVVIVYRLLSNADYSRNSIHGNTLRMQPGYLATSRAQAHWLTRGKR